MRLHSNMPQDVRQEDGNTDDKKQKAPKSPTGPKAIEAWPSTPLSPTPTTPQNPTRRTARQASTPQNRHSWAPENLNVRVVLEHQYPQGMEARRFSYSPLSNQEPVRYPSIRRRKSRSGLKEYGAKQALQQDDVEKERWRHSRGDTLQGDV